MSNATTGFNQSAYSSPTQRSSMPMNTYSYAMVSSDGVIYTWDVNAGNQPIGVATEIHEKLKAQMYNDGRFNALERSIEAGFCQTVKRPPFFPVGCSPCVNPCGCGGVTA